MASLCMMLLFTILNIVRSCARYVRRKIFPPDVTSIQPKNDEAEQTLPGMKVYGMDDLTTMTWTTVQYHNGAWISIPQFRPQRRKDGG